jgi:Tfp pilus assembly protein PilV
MRRAAPRTGPDRRRRSGLTLVELMVGIGFLVVAIVSLLGAFVEHLAVNENARHRAWATNDASRVMERLRRENSGAGCAIPTANPPAGFASWNAWLGDASAAGGGGKSIQPNPATEERVVVTPSGTDPLTVTVAICWRHRQRTLGECTWDGAVLSANPGAGGDPNVTESPVMLSTLMTCRS